MVKRRLQGFKGREWAETNPGANPIEPEVAAAVEGMGDAGPAGRAAVESLLAREALSRADERGGPAALPAPRSVGRRRGRGRAGRPPSPTEARWCGSALARDLKARS